MRVRNKAEFEDIVKNLNFRFAKTYANFAPHEYIVTNEEGEMLEVIRALNRFIQENYDEIEVFYNKEYQVLFVGRHKYWCIEEWNKTNILNRNWDYKNEDGTINRSITKSYLKNCK